MTVKIIDLPTTIKGFIRRTPDGDVIVINARLSLDAQRDAFRHELEHLKGDDLDDIRDADQIEALRHKNACRLKGTTGT